MQDFKTLVKGVNKGFLTLVKSVLIVGFILFLMHIIKYLIDTTTSEHVISSMFQIGALFGLATLNYSILMSILLSYLTGK
jgi:hypothetical protein